MLACIDCQIDCQETPGLTTVSLLCKQAKLVAPKLVKHICTFRGLRHAAAKKTERGQTTAGCTELLL